MGVCTRTLATVQQTQVACWQRESVSPKPCKSDKKNCISHQSSKVFDEGAVPGEAIQGLPAINNKTEISKTDFKSSRLY